MFIFFIILLISSHASDLYASHKSTSSIIPRTKAERKSNEQISVRSSLIIGDATAVKSEIECRRAKAKTSLRTSIQLSLEEFSTQSPIHQSSRPTTYKDDSIITDGIYGAGL